MRILHTSDWHIGRTFHGHQTLGALTEVLGALVEQVRAHDVDLVLVAGDVFDSAAPSGACFDLLTDTLVALRDTGASIVVTSGNHDSAARLGFQSRLLQSGIHVLTDPRAVGTPVTLADEHGPVHVYGLPFLEPMLVRHLWHDTPLRTHAQALGHAMGLVRADAAARGGRSVVMSHCFAVGGRVDTEPTPHLERDIQQGGLDVVPLSTFDGPDYVALGHIHGRAVLSERVRYSGAPLHYGFGENPNRGSWLVDLDADGLAAVEWLPLPVPRPLATVRGTLDELLGDPRFAADEQSWVRAEYTDTAQQVDVMRRLRTRFPYAAEVRHTPAVVREVDDRTFARRVRSARSDVELIDTFLSHVRAGEGATAAESDLVREVVAEVGAAETAASGVRA